MDLCFIDHECDTQKLDENTKPVLECKTYPITKSDGKSVNVTQVPMLTCETLWRTYQQEAVDIIAPGGKLIEDPIARNQAINSAYASLWLSDDRFQWAGFAAFASKQVGCGLMSAYNLMEKGGIIEGAVGTPPTAERVHRMLKGLQELLFPIPVQLSLTQKSQEVDLVFLEAFAHESSFKEDFYKTPGTLAMIVYLMLAWGNMLLFLDIFPLHAFYKKRGIVEFKKCLKSRQNLASDPIVSKYWTSKVQSRVKFGLYRQEILDGFTSIASGNRTDGVKWLAEHEQKNILQPLMYDNILFSNLMRANQMAYSNFGGLGGLADEIQLTLASECRVNDGRMIKFFENDAWASLANVDKRMEFTYGAAEKFDEFIHNPDTRYILEKSLREIKAGQSLL